MQRGSKDGGNRQYTELFLTEIFATEPYAYDTTYLSSTKPCVFQYPGFGIATNLTVDFLSSVP